VSHAREERARLFVALELPDVAREALVQWRSATVAAVRGLRHVAPENLHATLCFLGSRPVTEVDEIAVACDVAAGEPVVQSGFGAPIWLPRRRPGVLAVELSDAGGALTRLQATLSAALARGGWYTPESRPFLPHVTVARVGRDGRIRPVPLAAPPADPSFRCFRVTLYRSRLGAGGARYEALRVVELGSAPDPSSC
jgi:RNA 2',3'-cyclic 3'-phosphodiesterase